METTFTIGQVISAICFKTTRTKTSNSHSPLLQRNQIYKSERKLRHKGTKVD